MKANVSSNAFKRFILIAGSLYLCLYLIYQFIVKKYTYYDQQFIGQIIHSADFILNLFGFQTFKSIQAVDFQVVGVDGSNGVWIGSNCNAIKLFGLFAVFIVAYPGPVKHKLWYIPLGIVLIHVLNIFRVAALAIIAKTSPAYLDFNHTYTFTLIVYGFIFLLWMIWVNRFSNSTQKDAFKQA
ncbi:MAG: exosortase family protein XrtF [Bacteroidota bacterium]